MDVVYRLAGITKAYDGREVLDIDHLEIYRGEILAVVGPSGVGKSTLLRLLNFLEHPDRGTLTYENHLFNGSFPLELRRQVVTVFQKPALLHDTVENNVAYGLRLRRERRYRHTVQETLHRLGLQDFRRTACHTLSGGEAQRVALARALVIQPRVLLLDEPTANLDPYNVGLIEDVVRQINQERKTTVVLVTHNIFQAKRLATRVGLLLGSRLVELADCRDFFENPRDQRTRAFLNGELVY